MNNFKGRKSVLLGDFKINFPSILVVTISHYSGHCTEEAFFQLNYFTLRSMSIQEKVYQVTHPSLGLKKEMETMVLQQDGKDKIRFKEKGILNTMPT